MANPGWLILRRCVTARGLGGICRDQDTYL